LLNETFNFYDVLYMFRTKGFIFGNTVGRTGMVQFVYVLTAQADCLYRTTDFLQTSPRVLNM